MMRTHFALSVLALTLLILVLSCSTDRTVIVGKPSTCPPAFNYEIVVEKDYEMVVERAADFPVTYRPKISQTIIGVRRDKCMDSVPLIPQYPCYGTDYNAPCTGHRGCCQ
jgi:hypothetical protein